MCQQGCPSARVAPANSAELCAVRQARLDAAGGAYIAWPDDADRWLRGRLRELRAVLAQHPHVALAYGDCLDESGAPLPARDGEPFASAALLRAGATRAIGGYSLGHGAGADLDF